jgi:hypothetical protein
LQIAHTQGLVKSLRGSAQAGTNPAFRERFPDAPSTVQEVFAFAERKLSGAKRRKVLLAAKGVRGKGGSLLSAPQHTVTPERGARAGLSGPEHLNVMHGQEKAPRSPNLNAYAERFVRSIKESCLDRMIFFGRLIAQRN